MSEIPTQTELRDELARFEQANRLAGYVADLKAGLEEVLPDLTELSPGCADELAEVFKGITEKINSLLDAEAPEPLTMPEGIFLAAIVGHKAKRSRLEKLRQEPDAEPKWERAFPTGQDLLNTRNAASFRRVFIGSRIAYDPEAQAVFVYNQEGDMRLRHSDEVELMLVNKEDIPDKFWGEAIGKGLSE